MRQVYAGLPNVVVAPLHFAANDISGERLLAMMKVDVDQRERTSIYSFSLKLTASLRDASLHGGHNDDTAFHGAVRLPDLP